MRILIAIIVLTACTSERTDTPGPTDPGYDPVTYQLAGNRSMREVVWSEPRDDEWAEVRERDLTVVMPVDAELVSCRTSSCVAIVWVADAGVDDVLAEIPRIAPTTGARIVGGDDARTRLEIYALFPPSLHSHDGYIEWLEGRAVD